MMSPQGDQVIIHHGLTIAHSMILQDIPIPTLEISRNHPENVSRYILPDQGSSNVLLP